MRGVQVSELELNTSGGLTVKDLATIFEDGEVVGESYLASSLRKAVEARGPASLDTVIRLYNNGYYGASWIDKGRVYLKEGQQAPRDREVQEGPRGGRYYYTLAGRGRPFAEAPKGWAPQVGDRVRFRMTGDHWNGRLGKIREVYEEDGELFASVEGIGWKGGAGHMMISDGRLVPAPYTAKEKKEMTARDILVSEFGPTRRYDDYKESGIRMETGDPHTELEYDVYDTEVGVDLWVKAEPGKDKPWAATKESAVSLEAFMKALLEMSAEALQAMKHEVQTIIFSPVPNPTDRKTSQQIGSNFTSAASISMQTRIMHIYPTSKTMDAKSLAAIITHEVGHAEHAALEKVVSRYNQKLDTFWKNNLEDMPADPDRMRAIEKKNGIPPHPTAWVDGFRKSRGYELALQNPTSPWHWGDYRRTPKDAKKTGLDWMMIGNKSWSELTPIEAHTVMEAAKRTNPVSAYAHTNYKEYYAEAYLRYQEGELKSEHIMFEHFENLGHILAWSKWG